MFPKRILNFHYEGMIEPFKIIGNVYFVGTYPASAHLIDTGDGLILIDTGYEDTLFLVVNSIYQLGFSPYDIKYIIHTHRHGDHTAATPALKALTGAKTFIGEKDFEKAKKYFEADECLKDGDVISLGNTSIEIMETPGHTRGTISLFLEAEENGKKYSLGMFGGAGANTLAKGKFDYEGCREDYRESLNKLRKREIDVVLGNHVWNNDTEVKGKILRETGENQFINGKLWYEFLDWCEGKLDKRISEDKVSL